MKTKKLLEEVLPLVLEVGADASDKKILKAQLLEKVPLSDWPTSPSTSNTHLVQDDEQIQIKIIAVFLIFSEAHVNVLIHDQS
jgi:hypothetical protein